MAVLVACAVLASCTTEADDASTTRPDAAADDPTATDLILADLRNGDIDEPEAWLYRTWETFGYSALPERYAEAPSVHDAAFLREIGEALPTLPDDTADEIRRFLRRPSDPDSIFNGADEGAGPRTESAALVIAKGGDAAGSSAQGQCTGGWASATVGTLPFRVWECRDVSDAAARGLVGEVAAEVGRTVHALAPRMIADMGPPLPDDPDADATHPADEKIDIYIVPAGWKGPVRDGRQTFLRPTWGGVAALAPPYLDVRASSYIVLSADLAATDPPQFRQAVVHEVFHSLQRAHHARLGSSWFSEASAEWAASYYLREDSASLHARRLPKIQDTTYPLHATGSRHEYGAYLWGLYLEQEFGPEMIFDLWRAFEALPADADDVAILQAMDQHVQMEDAYPEFVMRMLNEELPGDPISPRFADLDANFPDRLPPMQSRTLEGADPLRIDDVLLEELGYSYYTIDVPMDGDDADRGVKVTLTAEIDGMSGARPTMEVLVEGTDGRFRRRPVHYRGGPTELCVSGSMRVVLTNTSYASGDLAVGWMELERAEEPGCAQIEANNPGTLARLALEGDVVRVQGAENDGEPDRAPLTLTVRDVPHDAAGSHEVGVTLTGGTLAGPRMFFWPLTDFQQVGESTHRLSETVTLDADLTDTNRHLTIDAELFNGDTSVSQHTPTVDLYGDRPCEVFLPDGATTNGVVDDAAPSCLTGDVSIVFDAGYASPPDQLPVPDRGTAHFTGTLQLVLGAPQTDEYSDDEVFPDAGSSWTMTGEYEFERCVGPSSSPCIGAAMVTERLSADSPVDAAVVVTDDGPELRVSLPYTTEVTQRRPNLPPSTHTERRSWDASCPVDGVFWYALQDADYFTIPEGQDAVTGRWNGDRTELTLDCATSWQPETYGGGGGLLGGGGAESGHVRLTMNGTLVQR